MTLCAFADDAAMSSGGSPTLLKGHPSISMVLEHVTVTVGKDKIRYDCTFNFQNKGPATSVKIGFPDRGFGAYETGDQEDAYDAKQKGKKKAPFAALKEFVSYVDGKKVAVKLEGTNKIAQSWHTKVVKFGANQSHVVRNTFYADMGSGVTNSGGSLKEARYVIHTGRSWKGAIGDAVVEFIFEDPRLETLSPISAIGFGKETPFASKKLGELPLNAVIYQGFGKMTVKGNRLIFQQKNLKPTAKDDLVIDFGYAKG